MRPWAQAGRTKATANFVWYVRCGGFSHRFGMCAHLSVPRHLQITLVRWLRVGAVSWVIGVGVGFCDVVVEGACGDEMKFGPCSAPVSECEIGWSSAAVLSGGLSPLAKSAQAANCQAAFPCLGPFHTAGCPFHEDCSASLLSHAGATPQNFSELCPEGWTLDLDLSCLAPAGYEGPCVGRKSFSTFSNIERESWGNRSDSSNVTAAAALVAVTTH